MSSAKVDSPSTVRIQSYQDQIAFFLSQFAKNGQPLNSTWTLYVDQTPKTGTSLVDYTQNLRVIYTFSTKQEFWRMFNSIPKPCDLPDRCSYHLMRGVRKPLWEANENGGYWKLKVSKPFSNQVWEQLSLAAIYENFSNAVSATDQIVGISFSARDKGDHFQIWNENWRKAKQAKVVEKVMDEITPEIKYHSVYYKEHRKHDEFSRNAYKETSSDETGKWGGKAKRQGEGGKNQQREYSPHNNHNNSNGSSKKYQSKKSSGQTYTYGNHPHHYAKSSRRTRYNGYQKPGQNEAHASNAAGSSTTSSD